MDCCFDSLPFLFPEAQRASLLAWKREAVKREKIHTVRRREQLRQLKHHVASRLQQLSKLSEGLSDPHSPLQDTTQPPLNTHTREPQKIFTTTPTPPTSTCPPQSTVYISEDHNQEIFSRPPTLHDSPTSNSSQQSTVYTSKHHSRGPQNIYSMTPTLHDPPPSTHFPHSTVESCSKGSDCQYPSPLHSGDVYVKVTALGRGFLTRRLLQSDKISSLIKTIKDGSEVLAGITEPVSQQDVALCERVHTQMQLARMRLLQVLQLPVGERMAYITHSRLVRQRKKERERERASSGRGLSGGRLSMATQRAIERRQQSTTVLSDQQYHKTSISDHKTSTSDHRDHKTSIADHKTSTSDHRDHKTSISDQRSHKIHTILPKPVSKQDNRSSGVRGGVQRRPVGHAKLISRPSNASGQDKTKAKRAETAIPSRTPGQGFRPNRPTLVSGQASSSGQIKSGRQRRTPGLPRPLKKGATSSVKTKHS